MYGAGTFSMAEITGHALTDLSLSWSPQERRVFEETFYGSTFEAR